MPGHASVNLRFLLLPSEIAEAEAHPGCVGGVRLQRARLEGLAGGQRAVVEDHGVEGRVGEEVEIECGLLLSAIGWRSVAATDEVPFDAARAVVPSHGARVLGDTPSPPSSSASGEASAPKSTVPGLYVAGWLKRGPSGIIGSNIGDAREAAQAIIEDGNMWLGSAKRGAKGLLEGIRGRVAEAEGGTAAAGGGEVKLVDWSGYHLMEEVEVSAGQGRGKPREKIVSVAGMLEVACS